MATKILAIDDSKTMRLAIKITFAAEDAEVTSVSKGSDAVARIKAKAGGYDVVLVDAQLAASEPTGYEVCKAIKADPATAKIPVVLLVNNQTGVDQAKFDEAGGDGFIAKPFDTQSLIDTVAEAQSKGARPASAAPAPRAATGPRPVVGAPPPAGRAAAAQRSRAVNRTQMGMPTPAMASALGTPPASSTPAPARTPTGPQPTVKAPAKPAAPARPAERPVAAPAPTSAARPAAGSGPAAAAKPAAAPKPAVAKPVAAKPVAAQPVAAQPVAAKPVAAKPAAAAPAATTPAAGGAIPIAIPIPFTAADSPTAGMSARLAAAAGSAGVDPKVAEALASLSREVVERIVWEVVPELAESIIREKAAKTA